MSLHESIQTSTIRRKIQRESSEMWMNRVAPIKDYSYSITSRTISQNATEACELSGGNDADTDVRQTEQRRQFFYPEYIIAKSYQLVFLDEANNEVVQDETLLILQELRTIVSDAKFINNVEDASRFIEQTENTTTFLVCRKNFGQIIASQTQILKNLRAIFVYDPDKQDNENWFSGYIKVSLTGCLIRL